MSKISISILAVGTAISLVSIARSDDIQFTALPQPVQTTIIRETHIANPSSVTRVVRDEGGVYAVTVRAESGERVVYVNPEGTIVKEPSRTTTTIRESAKETTVREPAQEQEVVTYEQVEQNLPRYQLLEKKDGGKKEIYLDRQTGKKVKVEREKGKEKVEGD